MNSRSPTPDSGLSGQNGTVIGDSKPPSAATSECLSRGSWLGRIGSLRNVHGPLRLTHAERRNCGRGCSGRGMSPVVNVSMARLCYGSGAVSAG